MRGSVKSISAIAAGAAVTVIMIVLSIFAVMCLFVWWLFTGLFLETEADMLGMPMPPIVFSQYTHMGVYTGYLHGYKEDMEYNEYYYHWRNVSFDAYPKFQPVAEESMTEICGFVRDYERRLEQIEGRNDADADKLCRNYRYKVNTLDQGDYYWVDARDSENPYSNYALCIFDRETNAVYHMSYRQVGD